MFKELFENKRPKKVVQVVQKVQNLISKNEAKSVLFYIKDSVGTEYQTFLYEGDNAFDIPEVLKNTLKENAFPFAVTDDGYGKMRPISGEYPFKDVAELTVTIEHIDNTENKVR